MENENTEGVIEKGLAFVKRTLGIPPGDEPPDVVAKLEYIDTEPTSQDALDPSTYTTKSVGQMSEEVRERVGELTMENETVGVPPDSEDTLLIPPNIRVHDLSTHEALRLSH